jgi:hypothetical protein
MKTCKVCQIYPAAKFEHGKCLTCYWDGVALERTARDMGRAEELRKEADAAFEAIKQEFLDFERGEDQ